MTKTGFRLNPHFQNWHFPLVCRTSNRNPEFQPKANISKILILGGTGNLSAECASLLYEQGHEIAVLTRGSSAPPAQYQGVVADRKDLTSLQSACSKVRPEVVINFLGYELADVQLDATVFQEVGQYLFISSTTVYSRPAQLPMTEASPKGNAWWEYAQKKLRCEQWLLNQWDQNRFPVTIIRPSHTYSKRWIPNPVSSSSYTFARRLEEGKPVFVPANDIPWTLTAATDFALGLAGLVNHPPAIGEAFHITSDEVLTWNQIAQEIASALNANSPAIIPIPASFICQQAPQLTGTLLGDKAHPGIFDNTKVRQFVPSFRCQKPFRVGIRESVSWLRQHPEQQNLNPSIDELCDRVVAAWRSAHAPSWPSTSPVSPP